MVSLKGKPNMLVFAFPKFPLSWNFIFWFIILEVAFSAVTLADFHPTTVKDQVMVKQVYRVVNVDDWMCCILECQGDSKCSSYNFEYDAKPNSRHICELSECAMNEKREEGLIWRRGFLVQQLKPSNKKEDLCSIRKIQKENVFNGLELSMILHGKDPDYLKVLLKYLGNETRAWKRCYHSGKPGLNVTSFHRFCDSKGPTVTIICVGKFIFGGYIDVSWKSNRNCAPVMTHKAFLFSLYNVKGFSPHKFSILPNSSIAAWLCADKGPAFGKGYDLLLLPYFSYSRVYSYEVPPGCKFWATCEFYTSTKYFIPSDVEVFHAV